MSRAMSDEAHPAGQRLQLAPIVGRQAPLEARQAGRDRRGRVRIGHAEGQPVEQGLEGDRGGAVEGRGVDEIGLGDADRVDDDEPLLRRGVGGDQPQVALADHPHPPALHLLEVGPALHRAHEEHALQRAHVGAGGDHVHGHGDARVVGVAELGDHLVGGAAGGLVGDLHREVVAAAELLAHDLDDVVGVGVVLGEDQGLRHLGAAGEDLGEEPVAERPHHGADLVAGHDRAIECLGPVGDVLVELLPAAAARLAIAELGDQAGLDRAAGLGDLGADAVDVEVDVDRSRRPPARACTPSPGSG